MFYGKYIRFLRVGGRINAIMNPVIIKFVQGGTAVLFVSAAER